MLMVLRRVVMGSSLNKSKETNKHTHTHAKRSGVLQLQNGERLGSPRARSKCVINERLCVLRAWDGM